MINLFQRQLGWVGKNKTALFWMLVAASVLLAVLTTVPTISRQKFGFDEGWDAQAAYNLSQHGKYASFGAAFDGHDKTFDPYISTGPAVMTPVAASFKLFGVAVQQARYVMLLFYLATLILLAWYVYADTKTYFAIIAPIVLLLISSSGTSFRIDILGEVPSSAFVLGSLIAWRGRKFVLAGLLASCAVLSKFLMLLLVVAAFIYFAIWLIRHWQAKRMIFRHALAFTLGGAIPLLLQETTRFFQIGGAHNYYHSLREFGHFFKANGSGVGSTGSVGLTIPHKLNLLVSNISLTKSLLLVAFILLLTVLVLNRKIVWQAAKDDGLALIFIGLYLAWWFILSDGAYSRYTVPLVIVGSATLLHVTLRTYAHSKPSWLQRGLLCLVLLCASIGIHQNYAHYHTPNYELTLSHQQQIAERIVKTKPQNIVQSGWWQNPEMLFLTGLHSQDIARLKVGEPYALLLSPAMRDISPAQYYQAELQLCQTLVFEDSGYVLCTGVRPASVKLSR